MIWAVIHYLRRASLFPCAQVYLQSLGGPSFILCGAVSGSLCGQLWTMQRDVMDLHLFWACTVQTQADGYRYEDREPALTWDWRPKRCNERTQLTHTESTVTDVLSIICSSYKKRVSEDIFVVYRYIFLCIWCLKKFPGAGLALKKINMLPDASSQFALWALPQKKKKKKHSYCNEDSLYTFIDLFFLKCFQNKNNPLNMHVHAVAQEVSKCLF